MREFEFKELVATKRHENTHCDVCGARIKKGERIIRDCAGVLHAKHTGLSTPHPKGAQYQPTEPKA